MRFFIALEIPDDSKQEIQQIQEQLKQIIPGTRLTNLSKLHLTIAFLGEQESSLQQSLREVMKKAVIDIRSFTVTPAYIDGFPDLHQAKILWTGVKGDIDKLFLLQERIKDDLVNLNLPVDERRYTPHITIAKNDRSFWLKINQEKRMQEIMLSIKFTPIIISSLKLFESVSNEGFHRHNTLAEIPLL